MVSLEGMATVIIIVTILTSSDHRHMNECVKYFRTFQEVIDKYEIKR